MYLPSNNTVRRASCALLAVAFAAVVAGCWHKPEETAPVTTGNPSAPGSTKNAAPATKETTAPTSTEKPAPNSQDAGSGVPSQPVKEGHYRFWQKGEVGTGLPKFMDYLTAVRTRPYFFVILLDETGMANDLWPSEVQQAADVVGAMDPGDAFMVIGITDNTKTSEDVRVPVTMLTDQTAMAPTAKVELGKQVKALKLRTMHVGSDFLGAFKQGAHYASEEASTHFPVVIGFTDLEPQDTKGNTVIPSEVETIAKDATAIGKYPAGTEGAFFYVSTPEYDSIEKYWQSVFEQVGVNVSPLPAPKE